MHPESRRMRPWLYRAAVGERGAREEGERGEWRKGEAAREEGEKRAGNGTEEEGERVAEGRRKR